MCKANRCDNHPPVNLAKQPCPARQEETLFIPPPPILTFAVPVFFVVYLVVGYASGWFLARFLGRDALWAFAGVLVGLAVLAGEVFIGHTQFGWNEEPTMYTLIPVYWMAGLTPLVFILTVLMAGPGKRVKKEKLTRPKARMARRR